MFSLFKERQSVRVPEDHGALVRSGGCQCGEVRYECSAEPEELYVCHCKECQHQSSSAFGISFIVLRPSFQVTRGEAKYWTRDTDTGKKLECAFCPSCGSRLWHQYSGTSSTVSIKGGSLDEPVDISHAIHIWTVRKLPSVIIPDSATQYLQEPDDVPEAKPEIKTGTSEPVMVSSFPASFCYPSIEATTATIGSIVAGVHTDALPEVLSETTSQLRASL